ncbi:hypothetical protein L208DRAFT_1375774 [Tricholoma matsutake]|nr:hypothetical protein L208DRAFT_1375774 [Tricholoma matsutake 945]
MWRMPGFLGVCLLIRGVSRWGVMTVALGATGVSCWVQEVTYGWLMMVHIQRGGVSQSVIDVGVMGRWGVREFGQGGGPRPGLAHWEEGHVVFRETLIDGLTFGFEVSTTLRLHASRMDMPKFLALVAADGFLEVFTDRDYMTCNIDSFTEEVVRVSTFESGCRDDGAWREEVAFLKLRDVEFVSGVESTIAGDKTEDKVGGKEVRKVSVCTEMGCRFKQVKFKKLGVGIGRAVFGCQVVLEVNLDKNRMGSKEDMLLEADIWRKPQDQLNVIDRSKEKRKGRDKYDRESKRDMNKSRDDETTLVVGVTKRENSKGVGTVTCLRGHGVPLGTVTGSGTTVGTTTGVYRVIVQNPDRTPWWADIL